MEKEPELTSEYIKGQFRGVKLRIGRDIYERLEAKFAKPKVHKTR